MKSIRLSLIVYFLALLAAALGVVSLIVYQFTQQALQAEERAKREKLELIYEERCQREEEKLDLALAERVRSIADRSLFRTESWLLPRSYQSMSALGLVGASAFPNGHLGTPLWAGMAFGRDAFRRDLYPRDLVVNLQLINEEVLPSLPDGSTEYYQINTSWHRTPYLSESLGEIPMAFDPGRFAQVVNYAVSYDEFELDVGHRVRRATLKTPLSRFAPFPPRPTKPPPGRQTGKRGTPAAPTNAATADSRGSSPAPPASDRGTQARLIYFQYAADTAERDRVVADTRAELARKLEEHHAESDAALASVRNRLIALSLVTFGLTFLGCLSLVRYGLSPLRRLSDAVSRVSEKDMRLQLDEARLPTELQPIVVRLQQTLGMLGRAFIREKQAAADISHELRTPLAALLTTTEVALRKPRSPEEYRELIQDCRSSCQQMSRLVERLLTLSRLDAGVDSVRPQEVDANELVEQCASLMRPLAEARGVSLRIHRNGAVLATVDPDKLREVLTNLLHNAIEYNVPQGSIEVSVEQQNGHVDLEVRDTGIGITPDAQRHIFERFYRADASRQADGMHAGLGLAIVKGYVDLMGGTITVQSTQGRGSIFRVQLPVRPNAATGF
jgi:heavy metal sensor kinase